MDFKREPKRILKNAVLGAVGGLASTVIMSGFMSSLAKIDKKVKGKAGAQFVGDDSVPSTGKVANKLSKTILNKEVSARNEKASGFVHFAFGTGLGILYGALANGIRKHPVAKGLIYGASVWAIADEFVLPRLKLSKKVKDYTLLTHAKSLAGHLVYGVALEATQNLLTPKTDQDLEARVLAPTQLH